MSPEDEQRSPEDSEQVHETVPHVAPGERVAQDPVGLTSPVTPAVRSKRGPKIGILAACTVVVLVVAGVITAFVTGPSAKPPGPLSAPAASENLVQQLTNVPESVFESVGLPSEISNYPKKVTGLPRLTERQLPELLWMGAGYCPFC